MKDLCPVKLLVMLQFLQAATAAGPAASATLHTTEVNPPTDWHGSRLALHGHVAFVSSPLIQTVLGCAIEVHRTLGPGLLESAYQRCLVHELVQAGKQFAINVPLDVMYKGTRIDCGYRLDVVFENDLIVEIKSVDRLLPIHTAQLLTYLKLADVGQGLLINFNVLRLTDGVRSYLL
jgi:GxxExxY protein